jgi:anaerobic magnesium-protoporphyrin IX monomethyl ester cyclase
MKKVLLINPPYPMEESPSPPFGLMSLAAYLIENNFDVIIEDYIVNPYSPERIKRTIKQFRPDIIGATGVTMNINKALNILNECKNESPGSIIVMGGPHVTFDAHNILNDNGFIDFIVRGEGELTCVELFTNLDRPGAYRDIPGISFRDSGTIVHNPTRDFIADINILPYPARHLVQISKYRALNLPLNMITSRGCPYECIFCVGSKMVGRRVRYFDTMRVVDEFEMLSKMNFPQINIVDDLFTSNKKRCTAICEEIMKRGIRQNWTAFARVDTVSPELLQIMKSAGCTMLCFGIESGNQEILDTVKKKTTLDKIEKAVAMCKDAGIVPMASYIMGLPGETPETARQTLEFARKLCSSYGYHILAPFPGTEVREMAEQYGLRILTSDWDKYDANQSVCESIHLPHQEVDRIVNDFNDGINRMVIGELKKYERGEVLSSENLAMVNNIISLDFNLKLINEEFVERYTSSGTNGNGIGSFIEFIASNSGMKKEIVTQEVERLVNSGCLKYTADGPSHISWS